MPTPPVPGASALTPDARWLALVATLPVDDPAVRIRALRTLEALGAAVMREGVFLLPDTAATRRALERLADYLRRNNVATHLLHAAAMSASQHEALVALLDRSARYEALIKVIEGLKLGYGVSDPGAISRVLHKQRRELDAISALDFFPGVARERAEQVLAEAEQAVHKLLFPAGAARLPERQTRVLGGTWATRKPLWADRLGCAWLIRRFIDPEANLRWLDKGEACPEGAIDFGFDGARFANRDGRVTFEEMVERFGLTKHEALGRIGAIVRSLEERDQPVPEAAGVQTLLQGGKRRATNEDELLREAEKTFDLLFDAY
jgi:hypothetical protein